MTSASVPPDETFAVSAAGITCRSFSRITTFPSADLSCNSVATDVSRALAILWSVLSDGATLLFSIFEIMLSAPSYKAAFGHKSTLSALHSLIHKGTLLSGYKTLGDGELADELAAVSGQAPNHDTKLGCTSYVDFPTSAVANKAGLVSGKGCVYPDTALTLGQFNQVPVILGTNRDEGSLFIALTYDILGNAPLTAADYPNKIADTAKALASLPVYRKGFATPPSAMPV